MKNIVSTLLFLLLPALTITAQTISPDSLYTTWETLISENEFDKALEVAHQGMEMIEKEYGKLDSNYINFNTCAGVTYYYAGKYDPAIGYFETSLELTGQLLGTDHPEYASKLNDLGVMYKFTGKYKEAYDYLLKSKTITEQTIGKKQEAYIDHCGNLAGVCKDLGRFDQAETLYMEVIELIPDVLGISHPYYSILMNNLAVLYEQQGKYQEAINLHLQALQTTTEVAGESDEHVRRSMDNLAIVYETIGDYENALKYYLAAVDHAAQNLGRQHTNYAVSLANLADFYTTIGRYEKAEKSTLEALTIIRESGGEDRPDYGKILNNLAGIYKNKGDYEKAIAHYLQALAHAEQIYGKEHYEYGIRANNLALAYQLSNQFEKAKPMAMLAVNNLGKSLGADHYRYGACLNNLGVIYGEAGQLDSAILIYHQALANTLVSLGENHPHYGIRMINLAEVHHQSGNIDSSLFYYKQAFELYDNMIRENFAFLSESGKESFLNTLIEHYHTFYDFALEVEDEKYRAEINTIAFDNSLYLKNLILRSMEKRGNLLSQLPENERTTVQSWLDLRRELARQNNLPRAYRSGNFSDMQLTVDSLEDLISREYLVESQVEKTTFDDIKNSLEPNEALVEVFHFHSSDIKGDSSTRYACLVYRPSFSYPEMRYLCDETALKPAIEQSIQQAPAQINELYAGRKRGLTPNKKKEQGRDLFELIWEPVDSLLIGATTVYYAPSGWMNRVAFAAIPLAEGQYLSDKYHLQCISSAGKLTDRTSVEQSDPIKVYLFGGIDYDAYHNTLPAAKSGDTPEEFTSRGLDRIDSTLYKSQGWDYLPGTEKEVGEIAKKIAEKGVAYVNYTGTSGREENLKLIAGSLSPNILHIATHGFFIPPNSTANNGFSETLNPLLRSGLILAGGNRTWQGELPPEGVEDGIVTGYEIAHLDFHNTELVVLSACETGLGDVRGSEGAYGLQRAFQMAGAKRLILSLWQVPDAQTQELMVRFYQKWLADEMEMAAAFRLAQREIREKYQNPYFWAGFVLVE